MLFMATQYDHIEIPKQRERQEAVVALIQDAWTRPLVVRGSERMTPLPVQPAPRKIAADVVPLRKRESPTPTPPHRPAPAQPLRPAAGANLEKLELVKKSLSTLTRSQLRQLHHQLSKLVNE